MSFITHDFYFMLKEKKITRLEKRNINKKHLFISVFVQNIFCWFFFTLRSVWITILFLFTLVHHEKKIFISPFCLIIYPKNFILFYLLCIFFKEWFFILYRYCDVYFYLFAREKLRPWYLISLFLSFLLYFKNLIRWWYLQFKGWIYFCTLYFKHNGRILCSNIMQKLKFLFKV